MQPVGRDDSFYKAVFKASKLTEMLKKAITGPVAVIGDVHGQVEQLDSLLNQIRRLPDYERRWVVFIGDLVDRGPDSKGAIDRVLELKSQHRRTAAIAGNHELAMSGALKLHAAPSYIDWSGRWLDHYGAAATFASYQVPFGDLDGLSRVLPEDHRDYLTHVPWCVEHPEYFFVHAGLDPYVTFDLQCEILRSRDFTLHRPQWLCSKSLPFEEPPFDCPYTVVSGHVRVPQVTFGKKRILIDTSGGRGGILSCVLLPENRVLQAGEPVSHLPGLAESSHRAG